MRTLGIVLAGGQSRRFGSDKAEAMLGGRTLLDHAIAALRPHCDALAIVGRRSAGLPSIADRPRSGLGPLGGLAGALAYAAAHDFAQVLSIPVDCAVLPPDIRALLEPAPSCIASQPVIGLWPAAAAAAIDAMLAEDGSRAVRAFAARIGARAVASAFTPANINTPGDLEQVSTRIKDC